MAVSDQPTPAADSAEDLAESASPQAGDSAPAPESGAPAGGAQQASTGLRVRVDFRAGQVELPLAELLALSEGQVLPRLDGVVFPRVEALSAGRVFAEGELVEVEGRVGFRITKLLR